MDGKERLTNFKDRHSVLIDVFQAIAKEKSREERMLSFSVNHPTEQYGDLFYFVCSKEYPMPSDKPPGSRWIHGDAVRNQKEYTEEFKCPHCQHEWEVELPE